MSIAITAIVILLVITFFTHCVGYRIYRKNEGQIERLKREIGELEDRRECRSGE